ncbi:MAG: Unknown protein [uncultured Sulfurovum sp.]|uniref:DUF1778 domain-containing protein n=1 Tax=uncultured Sulfurovum sp. TaxID=269237 RepID=A0A6S6SQW1_9BACT|nr:MAG: Unknown protein [uncultured Sulfurovum sp.]
MLLYTYISRIGELLMQTGIHLKDARIEFKTSQDIKTLLQEVSNSLGMDLSNFLISTAVQRAKEIQKEERILLLTNQEWDKFEDVLTQPKKPTKALKDLMALDGFEESK